MIKLVMAAACITGKGQYAIQIFCGHICGNISDGKLIILYHLFRAVTKYTVYSTIFPSHWITFAIEYINISCEVETKPGSSKLNDQPKQIEELRLSL